MRVGFVGLGRMGLPMARRVAAAGHEVTGFDASEEASRRAAAAGLATVGDLGALSGCEVVCTSLPGSDDTEEAYCAPGGLLDVLAPPAVAADLSTVSVETSRTVAAEARHRSIGFLDAPVSGTSIHPRPCRKPASPPSLEKSSKRPQPRAEAQRTSPH